MPSNPKLLATKTESVTTHALRDGDVIRFYGVLLRLRDRRDHGVTAPHTEEFHGAVITFQTDIVDDSENNGFIPPAWLARWVVQGNRLAKWARVTE